VDRFLVTAQEIASFESDGAVCLRQRVNAEWLDSLRSAGEEALALPPSDPEQTYFKYIGLWQKHPTFRSFCTESVLPELAASMLKTNKINLLYDQLFAKSPKMVDRTTWHNDQPYWPVRGWPAMSFWVALDDVDASVGALEFIRGSHTWNAWYQPLIGDEEGRRKSQPAPQPGFVEMPDFDIERERQEVLRWDMQAGDIIGFHALTVHGATGNTSGNRMRRAYSVRYAGAETEYKDSSNIPGRNLDLINPALTDGAALDSEMFPVVYES
jgi:ectoine hydroxylase-related dioxygenase (phytanoyl-CoA dioxygenase family)